MRRSLVFSPRSGPLHWSDRCEPGHGMPAEKLRLHHRSLTNRRSQVGRGGEFKRGIAESKWRASCWIASCRRIARTVKQWRRRSSASVIKHRAVCRVYRIGTLRPLSKRPKFSSIGNASLTDSPSGLAGKAVRQHDKMSCSQPRGICRSMTECELSGHRVASRSSPARLRHVAYASVS